MWLAVLGACIQKVPILAWVPIQRKLYCIMYMGAYIARLMRGLLSMGAYCLDYTI